MKTYKIIRFYFDEPPRVIHRGLTLDEAKEHCSKDNTHKFKRTGELIWFDGFTEEE